jgi:hypothetical protein
MQLAPHDVPCMELRAEENRSRQSILILRLFDKWNLSAGDQLNLLGLNPTNQAFLEKYRNGNPLSVSRDMQDREGWLLHIHRMLRILYPQNPELRYSWVSRRNRAFDNLPPMELMKEEGLVGIFKVARYLEGQC